MCQHPYRNGLVFLKDQAVFNLKKNFKKGVDRFNDLMYIKSIGLTSTQMYVIILLDIIAFGDVPELVKGPAWKAGERESVLRVRAPPSSLIGR